MMGGGAQRGDLFVVTLPAHLKAAHRRHSWHWEWVKNVVTAMSEMAAIGQRIVAPIEFATNTPRKTAEEGAVVVKSYESGGEILRFKDGAWTVAGHQPIRETIQ